jgi:hypothetical protein
MAASGRFYLPLALGSREWGVGSRDGVVGAGATRMSDVLSSRSSILESNADRHEKYVAVYAVHVGIIGVPLQNLSA